MEHIAVFAALTCIFAVYLAFAKDALYTPLHEKITKKTKSLGVLFDVVYMGLDTAIWLAMLSCIGGMYLIVLIMCCVR